MDQTDISQDVEQGKEEELRGRLLWELSGGFECILLLTLRFKSYALTDV